MRIFIGNIYSRVECSDQQAAILDRHLSVKVKGAEFSKLVRRKRWDGKKHFFRRFRKTVLTGLVNRVTAIFPKTEIIETRELSSIPCPELIGSQIENCLNGITLSEFQAEAAIKAIYKRRGILKMATNSGKTEIAAAISKMLGVKTIIIVHLKQLLHQTAERFEKRLGREIGRIGDGFSEVKDITVVTMQSLGKIIDGDGQFLQNFKCMFIDECHRSSSNTYVKIAENCPAEFRYGLSGTPFMEDESRDWQLMGLTGPVIHEVKQAKLMEIGWSAQAEVILIPFSENKPREEWPTCYESLLANRSYNSMISQLASRLAEEGDKILILTDRINHGKTLLHMINEHEYKYASFIDGSAPMQQRMKAIDSLRYGRRPVIIATNILDEGVDIPEASVLILASVGKSQVRLLQRIGRVLRKKEKNTATVFDFYYRNTYKYLSKNAEKDAPADYLNQHSVDRLKIYGSEGLRCEWLTRGDTENA